MKELMNIIGNRYGEVVVLRELDRVKHKNSVYRMVECKCDCGKVFTTRMTALTAGHVKSCGHHFKENWYKQSQNQKKHYENVKVGKLLVIKDLGVKDGHTRWLCKCDCGNETIRTTPSITTAIRQKKEMMCVNCRIKKSSEANKIKLRGANNGMYGKRGKLSPKYNPNKTDEERILGRKIDGYKEFISNSLKYFNYTCDLCGSIGGKLNIHHLDNYKDYPQKRMDIENVVCLCQKHHKLFHKLYKNTNNTREQYYEFKRKYRANQLDCE